MLLYKMSVPATVATCLVTAGGSVPVLHKPIRLTDGGTDYIRQRGIRGRGQPRHSTHYGSLRKVSGAAMLALSRSRSGSWSCRRYRGSRPDLCCTRCHLWPPVRRGRRSMIGTLLMPPSVPRASARGESARNDREGGAGQSKRSGSPESGSYIAQLPTPTQAGRCSAGDAVQRRQHVAPGRWITCDRAISSSGRATPHLRPYLISFRPRLPHSMPHRPHSATVSFSSMTEKAQGRKWAVADTRRYGMRGDFRGRDSEIPLSCGDRDFDR